MILGLGVRKYDDTWGIKRRYTEYFENDDVIFLYPGSDNLFSLCDAFVLIGGDDINPKLYNEAVNGSRDIDDDIDEWEVRIIEEALRTHKAILGICRGLQILNAYFGGSLVQDYPNHQNGEHEIELVCKLDSFPAKVCVNTYHHQIIKSLAKEFNAVYLSNDNVIEMIMHKNLPIFAVQFHPEMIPDNHISKCILSLFKQQIVNNSRD